VIIKAIHTIMRDPKDTPPTVNPNELFVMNGEGTTRILDMGAGVEATSEEVDIWVMKHPDSEVALALAKAPKASETKTGKSKKAGTEAEAERLRLEAEAEAEAERLRLEAESEAEGEKGLFDN